MALSNPQVHAVTTRASGALLAWFAYDDQFGKKFIIGPFKYPAGTDLSAEATNKLPYARQEARQMELGALVESGNYQGPFVHVQPDQVIKQMLRAAMRDPDPGAMLRIQALMIHLNTTYPGDLLASFLGVPVARVQALRQRYDSALLADLGTLRMTEQWQ